MTRKTMKDKNKFYLFTAYDVVLLYAMFVFKTIVYPFHIKWFN